MLTWLIRRISYQYLKGSYLKEFLPDQWPHLKGQFSQKCNNYTIRKPDRDEARLHVVEGASEILVREPSHFSVN